MLSFGAEPCLLCSCPCQSHKIMGIWITGWFHGNKCSGSIQMLAPLPPNLLHVSISDLVYLWSYYFIHHCNCPVIVDMCPVWFIFHHHLTPISKVVKGCWCSCAVLSRRCQTLCHASHGAGSSRSMIASWHGIEARAVMWWAVPLVVIMAEFPPISTLWKRLLMSVTSHTTKIGGAPFWPSPTKTKFECYLLAHLVQHLSLCKIFIPAHPLE